MAEAGSTKTFLDMNRYQWTVLFAAWLGWGFDVFDGLLFNYVAPNCVPTLLGIPIGSPEAAKEVPYWTAIVTSLLLLGWAAGGLLFGRVADKIGRTKTLLITMVMYAVGTAACAIAPNIWVLLLCRLVASLGIGGEWAAGAAMVAEVVPEKRRVEAGAILYTAAPMGLFLATYVTYFVQKVAVPGSPETAWRWVFLFGLLPAIVAFIVRAFVKEPERWQSAADTIQPRLRELFRPEYIRMWTRRGGGRAHHVVELQRVSSGAGHFACQNGGRRRRGMEENSYEQFQHWGAARDPLHRALRQASGPKAHVCDLLFGEFGRDLFFFRFADGFAHPAVHVLLHRAYRVRCFRLVHVLLARTLSNPTSGDGGGILLQRRARYRGDRAVYRRCRSQAGARENSPSAVLGGCGATGGTASDSLCDGNP